MLEKAVGFKQGKGGMWKSYISLKKDVQQEDAEKFLKRTAKNSNFFTVMGRMK